MRYLGAYKCYAILYKELNPELESRSGDPNKGDLGTNARRILSDKDAL